MIPKVIHYCWFGRNPLPKLAKKCIKSWKKYCPDYEIIEWNEDNFDISSAPLYVRQAYEAKKWAFVSDYVRLWALIKYGGIYLDTDYELIKSLDSFLHEKSFAGSEDNVHISCGIMGCEKNDKLFSSFSDYYDDALFYKEDGQADLKTIVVIITDICSELGYIPSNQIQIIQDFAIYPKEYFYPLSYNGILDKTEKTVGIHWFSASWYEERDRLAREAWLKKLKKDRLRHTPNRIAMRLLGEKKYGKLKSLLKRRK